MAVSVEHVEAVHAERDDRGEPVEHRNGDDGEPCTAQATPPLMYEAPTSEATSSPRTIGSVWGMGKGSGELVVGRAG